MPDTNQLTATNKDTTTYNVQERTFIKRPEPKVCPTCGQLMQPDVQPLKTEMSYYISGVEGAQPIVIASNEPMIKVQGIPMYRVTGEVNGKKVSAHIPIKQTTTQPK